MTESVPGPFFTTATPSDHLTENNSSNTGYFEGLSETSIHSFFEIDATSEWIKNGKHRRIALQFPDSLLPYSKRVTKLIESKICEDRTSEYEKKTFVLADTSYRSCCVDEVAAAHADCTALVHFGEACHSAPTDKIDVKYVLGNMPTLIDNFKSELQKILNQLSADNIVLLMDSCFSHEQTKVEEAIREIVPPTRHVECASLPSEFSLRENRENVYLGRVIPPSLQNNLQTDLIFCGFPKSPLLPVWLLSYPSCISVSHYNPMEKTIQHETTRSSRLLRKRLFLVEKLKDADTVGLVVGSVGVDKHREAVKRMRELCKKAGKKIYVISVGKINVPKLSNFSTDIDVFVLLSCPFGVVLDSSDYFRPVVSFFEAEIALNPAKTWAADFGWSAEFAAFLEDKIETEVPEDSGDFSLISGKVRVQTKEDEKAGDGPKSMVIYNPGYCNDRTWKGLDDGVSSSNDSTAMTEGRSGIAQGYSGK